MKIWRLILEEGVQSDLLWDLLESRGIQCLYSEEGETGACLYVGSEGEPKPSLDSIRSVEEVAYEGVDWESQWADFAEGYASGQLHLNLLPLCPDADPTEIHLDPGGGFGDLSHPTTRQALRLMSDQVKGHRLMDLGTGSGILALAGFAFGAAEVLAVDIDPAALAHTARNAEVNGVEIEVGTLAQLKENQDPCDVVVMNMITSEQEVAWTSLGQWENEVTTVITSGILEEQEEAYLAPWLDKGWSVHKRDVEGEWLALVLKKGEA